MKKVNAQGIKNANKHVVMARTHLQPEKIPQIHHAKSSPQCENPERSGGEVLVLAKPLSPPSPTPI